MRLLLSMFWRDLRSGIFNTILLALVIATTSLSSVGFLSERILLGLEQEKSAMLGADMVLRSHQPIPDNWKTIVHDFSQVNTASTIILPSMVYSQKVPDLEQLVTIKAVSSTYPLRGCLKRTDGTNGVMPCVGEPSVGKAWVDPQLLEILSISIGDSIQIGESTFIIDSVITEEPDSGSVFASIAPRVMIALGDLAGTELMGVGSRAQFRWLLSGNSTDLNQIRTQITPLLLEQYQVFESIEESRPELQNTIERGEMFLSLVALLSAMIASIALALASIRYSHKVRSHIAILRCLGFTARRVIVSQVFSFMCLGILGGIGGAILGWGIHFLLLSIVKSLFTVALPNPTFLPSLKAILVGLILTFACVLTFLWPFYRIAPHQVLRKTYQIRRLTELFLCAPLLISFFALLYTYTNSLWLTVRVGGGLLLVMLSFLLLSTAILWLFKKTTSYFPKTGLLQFALASLLRRKLMVVVQISALSFGLVILLLLLVVQRDMLSVWQNSVPPDAPNKFIGNIALHEKEALWQDLQSIDLTPEAYQMSRGRMIAVNGQKLKVDQYENPRAKAFVEREFNVGFMDPPPLHNTISQGVWFSDSPQAEVSIEESLMEALNLKVGDQITWNFAGQTVETTITGARAVNWSSLQVNFYAIMPSSMAKTLPITWVSALRVSKDEQAAFGKTMKSYPGVLVWNLETIFTRLQGILQQVGSAVQLLSYFSLMAGCLVLYTALAIHINSRTYEFSLLRSLGATTSQLVTISRLELWFIGIIAGVLGYIGAQVIAYALMSRIFSMHFYIPFYFCLLSIVVALIAVLVSAWKPLKAIIEQSPIHLLRTHSG